MSFGVDPIPRNASGRVNVCAYEAQSVSCFESGIGFQPVVVTLTDWNPELNCARCWPNQMLNIMDVDDSLSTVEMAGRTQVGGIGGMSLDCSPTSNSQMVMSSDCNTTPIFVDKLVRPGMAERIPERISLSADEVGFLPTHGKAQVARLTRDVELYFLSPDHFVRPSVRPSVRHHSTSAFDNCAAIAISTVDQNILVAAADANLMLAQFVPESNHGPLEPTGVDIHGALHPLVSPSDGMKLLFNCKPKQDSKDRGIQTAD